MLLKKTLQSAARPSIKTTLWLLRIMLPVSLTVSVLQYYGVIGWMAGYLDPLFVHIGLPGSASVAFVTAASVTTYAGIAVMTSLDLTMREATILSLMALICHALPMECAVVKKVGSNPLTMAIIRIMAAFLAAFYLNAVLPEMEGNLMTSVTADSATTLAAVVTGWMLSSLRMSAMIFGIILSLMVIQRLMDAYNIMPRLVRPLHRLMLFFGLPPSSAYLWLVGNILGISYGAAAMIDLEERGEITSDEANETNYHLVMNHSMLEDTMVYAAIGISPFWILSTRMLFAFVLVWGRKALRRIAQTT